MSKMFREIFISLYLSMFRFIFFCLKLFPVKEKVSFVVSFGDNSQYVYDKMKTEGIKLPVIFICQGLTKNRVSVRDNDIALSFHPANILEFIHSIYHLATSKYIIVDNYFGFLAVCSFKKEVTCVQLWHAAGAIKKFGLADQSITERSGRAVKRFLSVYHKFNKVVVGSDEMSLIFQEAFGISENRIWKTGIPRTDFFFDKQRKSTSLKELTPLLPNNKKTILYAPTYRDNELEVFQLKLDLAKLQKELSQDYIIILKLHPAIRREVDYEKEYPGFIYDFSKKNFHVNEILLVTDYLITDYSSIPYEYALLNKPMIFFPYDLEEYTKERGLWDDYERIVPGPIVKNTSEIISIIQNQSFDLSRIQEFSAQVNKYSQGNSSYNLLVHLFKDSNSELAVNKKQNEIIS